MFKSGDSRAVWTWVWTWKYLSWALHYYTESVADQTDHFADVFVRKNVAYAMTLWRRYDVRKYTTDAILFREIQCKKMDILMF